MPTNTQLQQQFVAHLLDPPQVKTTLSQDADRASLLSCIAQISVEIGETSDQLVSLMKENAGELHHYCELAQLFEQASGLDVPLDGKTGVKQELAHALQQQIELEHDIVQEDAIIQTLELLSKFQEQTEQCRMAREAQKFCTALDSIEAMDSIMLQLKNISQADILLVCQSHAQQMRDSLAEEVGEAFSKLIQVKTEEEQPEIFVDTRVPDQLSDTLHALVRLGTCAAWIEVLVHSLLNHIIHHCCNILRQTFFIPSDELMRQSESMYKGIHQVLVFVLDLLNISQDESTIVEIKRLFTIPVEYSLLDSFDIVNKETRQFNDKLKQLGLSIQEDNSLLQFTTRTEHHYARKKHRHCLESVRKLLANYNFTSVELQRNSWQLHYTEENTVDATTMSSSHNANMSNASGLPQDPFSMPTCLVSTSIVQLEQMIRNTIKEACQLSPTNSVELLQSIREMAQLFQILCTGLAMQFHNDCMLLAHCFMILDITYEPQWPKDINRLITHFTDLVPVLRHLGQSYFNRIVANQQNAILEAYNELDGLYDAGENERYEKIQQTILQTVYQIRKLSDVWKSTLPLPLHDRAMGQVIDHLVVQITKDIIELTDISEDESYQLHKACQMLFELASIFRVKDQQPPPSHYVPNWTKFRQLVELLELNFADIMIRFRDHRLDVFTVDELTSILCALFSDTPLRKRNLEEIRNTRME
ncbi:Centromere/kinetochore Zw10-domain-containing protein [Syncephalis plumigaleata]|nr:Centromere/kinetochore Zw10-domain-containing protein [Syncephalis plumigaleata]